MFASSASTSRPDMKDAKTRNDQRQVRAYQYGLECGRRMRAMAVPARYKSPALIDAWLKGYSDGQQGK